MKLFTGFALGCALAVGTILPVLAQAINSELRGGMQVNGEITNLSDTEMTIQTTEGTQVYKVNPEIIRALNLSQGSDVVIDGSLFETGRIVGLDSYTVEVDLDNGEREHIIR